MNFPEYKVELRSLMRLAVPIALAQVGQTLMGVVDTAVVGRLGAAEIGAVGVGNSLFWFVGMFASGVVMGVDPLVSQAVGANDPLRARRILWQGIYLALAVAAVLTIPLFFSPRLLPLFHVVPDVERLAWDYTKVRTLSLAPLLMFVVIRSYLQGKNVTRPMVVSIVIANVANLALDLALVFGGSGLPAWCGPLRAIPAFGVTGAAIATVLCSLLQLAIIALAVPKIALPPHEGSLRTLLPADFRRGLRVGLPVGFQLAAEVGIFALVGLVAGSLGKYALAAHQVTIAVASFTFTFAVGVGSAGSVRVGLAVGAMDERKTRVAGLTAFSGGALIMSVFSLVFAFLPDEVAALISSDPSVIAATVPVILIAAIFQIFDGIQAVGAGVLRGAADTRFAFIANLIGHWGVGLPIAWYLGFHLQGGITGLWWGLCAGLIAVAILLFVRFTRISSRPIRPVAHT
ncbi:MAG: MATE family efflux transporter [Acidobacteria bacterium]|nr:MATE family efflux transporter [Acidobacteriota bacterium]